MHEHSGDSDHTDHDHNHDHSDHDHNNDHSDHIDHDMSYIWVLTVTIASNI
jgi:hypothetical protein